MSRIHFITRLALLLLVTGSAIDGLAQAKPKLESIKPKVQCSTLVGYMIPAANIALPTRGATIMTAELTSSAGQVGAPDYVPEYCRIRGAIKPVDPAAPDINFGLNVPTQWNQKAWHIAGQGLNGIIPTNVDHVSIYRSGQQGYQGGSPANDYYPPNAPSPIGQGYATFGGDSGHQGGYGRDAAGGFTVDYPWVPNDEAWTNFMHAALKKTHDASEAILKHMYGTASRVTYFGGLSQGGREALTVANMYPGDYDGVVAGSPLAFSTSWTVQGILRVKAQMTPGAWVPPSKEPAVRNEILRLCDDLDGIADGIISNYAGCSRRMDPNITSNPLANIRCPEGKDAGNQCLSDAQMTTVNSWHTGGKYGYALANGETDWPGYPAGGENQIFSQTQPTPANLDQQTALHLLYMRGGFRDKNFKSNDLDLARDREKILVMSKAFDVRADWSKFLAKGGKIIYTSPSNDYLIDARLHQRIYEIAVKNSGQATVDRGARFYVSPQSNHGGSGKSAKGEPLPQYVDFLGTLENWVENGVAPPEPLVQVSMEPNSPFTVTGSRPLCRYPQYPHYNGSGDPKVAGSYTCRTPSAGGTTVSRAAR